MKRIFKILLGLAAAVIVLLILTAFLLPMIYDKEDLKKAIAVKVHEQTGRDLTIDGALDFSVFPWLAVEVSELRLSNAEGFGDQSFAKIGQARVGVALMPLFQKKIVVDEVTLDGLDLSLAVNARGQNNWDDLADGGGADTAAPTDGEAGLFSSQRVAGLNIRNARIEFQDQQAGAHYRLSDLSLQTGALGDGKPLPLKMSTLLEDLAAGTRKHVELAATASIDLEAEQYSFEDFELSLTDGEADSPAIRIRAPRMSADLVAQTLQMESFTAELAGLEADGAVVANKILDDPAFSGSLSIKEFSPVKLMQAMQMEAPSTADPEVLHSARINTSFTGSSTQISLSDFELALDQSIIGGELNIHNFDQPTVRFDFAVDAIDIDRYLEPGNEQAEQADVAMPQEELQGQDVKGTLNIGQLRLAGLEFSDANLGLAIRNGKLRLNPLTAGFYGGRYSGDITIDSSGGAPVLSLDENVDSITFQRLVADLVDTESLSGVALGHVKLTGRGSSSDEVMRSLNGDLGLTLTEGALEGINIWYEIRRGFALYKGLPLPPEEPKRTVFSRMQMVASVKDGVVTSRELVGELPYLTVRGEGAIDLGQSNVDLGLVASIRDTPELAQDPLTADLGGKSLPFKVSGSLDDPTVAVDWEALLKSEATDMILDKLGLSGGSAEAEKTGDGEEAKSSKDQIEDTAKGALFNLLKGKDKKKDKDKDDDS